MGGTPYSILDGLRNACQPTRHSGQPARMNVGAAMWGLDREHTTSFHQLWTWSLLFPHVARRAPPTDSLQMLSICFQVSTQIARLVLKA